MKKLVWGSLIFLLLLPVLWIFLEHARGKGAWESRLQELERKGEKLSPALLAPPPVNPDDNIATVMVGLSNELENASALLDLEPPRMKWTTNGNAIGSWQVSRWKERNDGITAWETFQSEWERHSGLVEELVAAMERPRLNLGAEYTNGFTAESSYWPSWGHLRNAGRLLAVAAVADLRRNDLKSASRHIRASIMLTERLGEEPLVIVQLVRQAMVQGLLAYIWASTTQDGWTDGQLMAIQQAWSRLDIPKDMLRSMEMERAMNVVTYQIVRQSPTARQKMVDLALEMRSLTTTTGDLASWMQQHVQAPLWRVAWMEQDACYNLNRWQKLIERARLAGQRSSNAIPALTMVLASAQKYSDLPVSTVEAGELRNWYDRQRYLLAGLSVVTDGQTLSALRVATVQQMALAAIALKRYQLRQGTVPASLNELIPQFLSELPWDYYAAQPLRYRRLDAAHFLLYSVGKNGQDDGGERVKTSPDPASASAKKPSFFGALDMVWPEPATPEEVQAYEEEVAKASPTSAP